jgi:transcriptional regulator with XRE-family HTH domain
MALTPLRRARLEADLTQFTVSHETGISTSRISLLERSLVEPTDEEAQRLAKLLKRPPADLRPMPRSAR